MPQAVIKINGTAGSNTDLPINTLVSLDNQNSGGELTYLWTILDQPAGPADALSASNIQSPTFTPRKEGSYLIELVVNQGDATEQRDQRIAGVRQLKTRIRIPAAGESTETSAPEGWHVDVSQTHQLLDARLADPGIAVGVAGGTLPHGAIVAATGTVVIKSGLPGQETLPQFTQVLATTLSDALSSRLGVVEGKVPGTSTALIGDLVRVRLLGLFQSGSGVAVAGQPVYVHDTGVPSLTPGTFPRKIGMVSGTVGATYQFWVDAPSQFGVTDAGGNTIAAGQTETFVAWAGIAGTDTSIATIPAAFRKVFPASPSSLTVVTVATINVTSLAAGPASTTGGSITATVTTPGAANTAQVYARLIAS